MTGKKELIKGEREVKRTKMNEGNWKINKQKERRKEYN